MKIELYLVSFLAIIASWQISELRTSIAMPIVEITNQGHFLQVLNSHAHRLIVADFTATWCGPCKVIAPIFMELSNKYPNAIFIKIDVDKCRETSAGQGVTAMPTFIFYKNKVKIDLLQGADQGSLEAKILQHYDATETAPEQEKGGVPGYLNLSTFIAKQQCEALNESDDHPLSKFLESSDEYLESDCDAQLIICLGFTQPMKIHSIKFDAPETNGPKTVKLFINQPNALDFETATRNESTQELELKSEDFGNPVNLRFVKFQNVQDIQIFVKDNQDDSEVTRIDNITLYGLPINVTNMGEFKRIAGKAGEAH